MLPLGTDVANWQIKDFSVALRRQITEAARQGEMTVADWLHNYFTRHGIDGPPGLPVKFDRFAVRQDDLARLVELAARFAETRERMPRGLAGELSRVLRESVRATLPPLQKVAPPPEE